MLVCTTHYQPSSAWISAFALLIFNKFCSSFSTLNLLSYSIFNISSFFLKSCWVFSILSSSAFNLLSCSSNWRNNKSLFPASTEFAVDCLETAFDISSEWCFSYWLRRKLGVREEEEERERERVSECMREKESECVRKKESDWEREREKGKKREIDKSWTVRELGITFVSLYRTKED